MSSAFALGMREATVSAIGCGDMGTLLVGATLCGVYVILPQEVRGNVRRRMPQESAASAAKTGSGSGTPT
ncbi:hypothetical protein GCM10012286_20630 [Streptomyces lasiicapitis]|uniref:Uncharacterized protein n=1 Tax=Streptomyces lasiicapitis TaxID=1923961 RepID=A0ABQ2LP11_9ACTN|nr:hypothetical protein GCM10012286_20630 [Streptomyces lasiicapitis]